MSALDKFFDSMIPTRAALADWKTPAHTLIKYVVEKNLAYTFDANSSLSADGDQVIAPIDQTPGRWIASVQAFTNGNFLATLRGYDMP